MKRSRRRVEKEDFGRVLLTETATYDVPIIFSNLGFYWHWKKHSEGKSFFPLLMERLFTTTDSTSYTIPFAYKVRKNSDSFRSISIIHPRSQLPFIEFYKSFDQQILLACQKSDFSIRYPDRIGSKYYVRNSRENRSKYKSRATSSVDFESRSKHLSSYFSYRSHTRLHNFFDSTDYLSLEKKFSVFWTLDVARCFDSVYTHSITWALKTKRFSKAHRNVANAFATIFDRLMQSTNYNETAGIVIGSEISRIFTEIIFQQIDKNILDDLEKLELRNEEHYTIRRYVDDIFIFAKSDETAKKVMASISDCLKEYKFSLNESKTTKAKRPFITEQSRAIRLVKNSYARLMDQLLESVLIDEKMRRVPRPIYNRKRLVIAFLQEVKLACFDSSVSYSMACGYLVSVFSNLLTEFIEDNSDFCATRNAEKTAITGFIYVVVQVIFSLYTVSPSQSGSIKIAIIIDAACGYFDNHIPDESNAIRSQFYTLANDFFESSGFSDISKDDNNVTTLESLNILAAIRSLGNNFLISRDVLSRIVTFRDDGRITYFEIITLLYYIGEDSEHSFAAIRKKLKTGINSSLADLTDIKENAEKIYLLLDVLSCPYLDNEFREKIARRLFKFIHSSDPSAEECANFTAALSRYPWFTSWGNAETINSLEKKLLLRSY